MVLTGAPASLYFGPGFFDLGLVGLSCSELDSDLGPDPDQSVLTSHLDLLDSAVWTRFLSVLKVESESVQVFEELPVFTWDLTVTFIRPDMKLTRLST